MALKSLKKLDRFIVEMQYFMQEPDDLISGDLYLTMFDVVVANDVDTEKVLDNVYAIAYQKLLESVINALNLRERYIGNKLVYSEFDVYDIASKMVVINTAVIYSAEDMYELHY